MAFGRRKQDRDTSAVDETAETALELLQNRRALRVEWAIVGLIVFEIVLTLVQWALGVGR